MKSVPKAALSSAPRRIRLLSQALMIVMAAVLVLERSYTFDEPLDRDIAGYAILSHEMLKGRKLYSDLWERKPPLVFAVFAAAERLVGYGRSEILLVNLTAAIGTLILIFFAGGIFSAILWTLLCGDMWVQGNQPNAEVLVNLFLTGGFAILARNTPAHRRAWFIAAGAMFAAATLCKHHVIVICAALLAADLLRQFGSQKYHAFKSSVWNTILACGVIAAIWAGVVGYFLLVGRFNDFYSALFRQNAAYAGSLGANLLHSIQPKHLLLNISMVWAIAPVALVALWLMSGARHRGDRPWSLLIAYAASAWIAVALPSYFWGHYYQLLIPPFCIGGAWAIEGMFRPKQNWPASLRYGLVGAVLAITACWQAAAYRISPENWAREKYNTEDLPGEKAIGLQLRQVLRPGESVWELGEENEIYFESGKSPPTGLLYFEPVSVGPEREVYAARMLADLKKAKPDLIIINHSWEKSLPADCGILPWIESNYVPDQGKLGQKYYVMLLRRGSDLERRLTH